MWERPLLEFSKCHGFRKDRRNVKTFEGDDVAHEAGGAMSRSVGARARFILRAHFWSVGATYVLVFFCVDGAYWWCILCFFMCSGTDSRIQGQSSRGTDRTVAVLPFCFLQLFLMNRKLAEFLTITYDSRYDNKRYI